MNNGLSGWSCIYCGQELSGPQEGQEHQGTRDCRGSFSGEAEYVHPKPEIVDAWADGMLNEATSEMHEKDIEINPENLSAYFEENYQLPWTPDEAAIWLIDRELKAVQSVECVVNKCDSIDRNACGHVTEINHEVPEDSIYPSRSQKDVCACKCHTLYDERDALLSSR